MTRALGDQLAGIVSASFRVVQPRNITHAVCAAGESQSVAVAIRFRSAKLVI